MARGGRRGGRLSRRRRELDRIEESGHDVPSILVATIKTTVRNRLREEFAFVRWEDRGPHAIVCDNVHRVKGLEFDFVILVVTAEDVSDLLRTSD